MCKLAEYDPDMEIYNCKIICSECLFIKPDKTACDEIFGTDAEDKKVIK